MDFLYKNNCIRRTYYYRVSRARDSDETFLILKTMFLIINYSIKVLNSVSKPVTAFIFTLVFFKYKGLLAMILSSYFSLRTITVYIIIIHTRTAVFQQPNSHGLPRPPLRPVMDAVPAALSGGGHLGLVCII